MDTDKLFKGVFDITYHDGTVDAGVNIIYYIMDTHGATMFLINVDGDIYNFQYIVRLDRVA